MTGTTSVAVAAAVATLYSGDAAQQAQANAWLTGWQQSQDAWAAAFALLAAEQPHEVQFFAAAALVRKVRAEWSKLETGQRQPLGQAIRSKLQEVVSWHSPPVSPMVTRQLCAALAAAVGVSGGEGGSELVAQALALLGPSPALWLALLTALAEEADDLDRVRRLGLVSVLQPQAREVLARLGELLAGHGAAAGEEALGVAALRCAEAWLRLNQTTGAGCTISPGELHSQQARLFGAVVGLAARGGAGATEQVAGAAFHVLMLVFGPDTSRSDEAADAAATDAVLAALVPLRGRLAGASAVQVAGVAQLGSALAEHSPEHCCLGAAAAVPFSELMLECLALRDPAVVESSLDFFLMVNTVPLAERRPELGAPLYSALLQRLVPHITYPPGFSSWEQCTEVDEDDFLRLREQLLPEAFDVAYGLLRMGYLSHAWQLLQGAASWQDAEAALYLFRAVSLSVRTRALSESSGAGVSSGAGGAQAAAAAAVAHDRQQTQQLLAALFGQALCSSEGAARMLGAHGLLAQASCRVLHDYATWFGKAADAPLHGAFAFLLQALAVPAAAREAASTFQALCLRCAWRLKDAATVAALIEAAHSVLEAVAAPGSGGLAVADRQLVVEGLARIAAGLQGQQLLDAAAVLTRPFIQRAQAAVAAAGANGAGPSPVARLAVADNLRLLAAALRFIAPAGDDSGAVAAQPVAWVLEEVGPTLRAVGELPAWQQDGEPVAALVECYHRAVCSARKHGAQLLPAVLPALGGVFAATALPACLDVLGELLELHFQDGAVAGGLAQALGAACAVAFPRLQPGLREQQALADALLGLADQFAVYAPAELWPSPLLPPLLQLAAAAVRLREAEPVARSLGLLGHVLGTHARAADEDRLKQSHLDAAHAALGAQGEVLVAALLAALCDSCPRHLMRAAADCLRATVSHPALGPHAGGWLTAALASGVLPGVVEGYLTQENCATFCALALGGGLRGPRFTALVVDFGLLARGSNTSDVLLAYEM
eukprot:scaffold21.g2079.t1